MASSTHNFGSMSHQKKGLFQSLILGGLRWPPDMLPNPIQAMLEYGCLELW